jgi:hypothetical protein
MSVDGGPSTVVCDVTDEARGGSWSEAGVIVLAQGPNNPVVSVPESGGTPTTITSLDSTVADLSHRWPVFLPGGQRFLFTVWTNSNRDRPRVGGVFVGSLVGGEPSRLVPDASNAAYVPVPDAPGAGYLLFGREQTLLAVPFDAERAEVSGAPVAVVEDVQYDALTGRTIVDAAQNGTLLYRTGSSTTASQLEWLDRRGQTVATLGDVSDYWHVKLSPDAQRLAMILFNANGSSDLWIMDIQRHISSRLTFGASSEWNPLWSPDMRQVVFTSDQSGVEEVYLKAADGSGERHVLIESRDQKVAHDWSPDGRFILYARAPAIAGTDYRSEVWIHDTEAGTHEQLLRGEQNYSAAWFSPDQRWITYVSDESGRPEVYVRPFPEAGGRWQISSAGGDWAAWRDDGAEIVYRSPIRSTQHP